ncbi:hypothetical protein SAMN04488107_3252 [Geodermatophilus saharensis]|uniref:Uncharacterized protein n=1 Tax=Geodermatophilus saharensis TaxID=1137994 RepID=A0A239G5E1_9ACTN|nr:DUF6264 family protein [Geodermatophilus saharensis]SNS63244.1 hypothetical protein SAMN04488107_3252 [Geodermatophilus saharensis]
MTTPGTTPGSPWADPDTQTEEVAYAGPPSYATPPAPASPPAGYGWAPPPVPYWAYGPPAPPRPRRPGQVVAAAVLAFVQAGVVALSSAYLLLLASTLGLLSTEFGGDAEADSLVTEAVVVTVVQLLSAVALVVGGILVLNRRSRPTWLTLLVGFAVQLVLCLYWVVRLSTLDGFTDEIGPGAVLIGLVLFFAAAPAVGLGLLLAGSVRRWADGPEPAEGGVR